MLPHVHSNAQIVFHYKLIFRIFCCERILKREVYPVILNLYGFIGAKFKFFEIQFFLKFAERCLDLVYVGGNISKYSSLSFVFYWTLNIFRKTSVSLYFDVRLVLFYKSSSCH